jgi:diacylglycerol kinase (ATP)
MRTIYIVNVNAKNSHSIQVWKKFRNQLKLNKRDIYYTASPEEVKNIVQCAVIESLGKKLLVVGVGGDGTISGIINQCIGYENVTVGYLPAGSGNDFARGYLWPVKAEHGAKAVQLVQQKQLKEKYHDTGYYELEGYRDGHFVNSIGAGFDATITEKAANSSIKKWLNKLSMGKLIYAVLVLSEAITYKPTPLEAVINGEKKRFTRTWFITISNQPYYGGGMKISPTADSSDGLLDITIVHSLSRLKLLVVFLSVFSGRHTLYKEVETYKAKDIVITSAASVPVQADGDYIGMIEEGGKLAIKVHHHNWKTADMR